MDMEHVTLEDLRKYRERKEMVRILREDIRAHYLSSPAPAEVKGGRSSVHTPSDPTKTKALQIVEMKDRLEKLLAILEEQTERIERYSVQIDDQIIGAAIRYHFIRGLSWGRTSIKMYGSDAHKDAIRKAVTQYVEESRNVNEETDT